MDNFDAEFIQYLNSLDQERREAIYSHYLGAANRGRHESGRRRRKSTSFEDEFLQYLGGLDRDQRESIYAHFLGPLNGKHPREQDLVGGYNQPSMLSVYGTPSPILNVRGPSWSYNPYPVTPSQIEMLPLDARSNDIFIPSQPFSPVGFDSTSPFSTPEIPSSSENYDHLKWIEYSSFDYQYNTGQETSSYSGQDLRQEIPGNMVVPSMKPRRPSNAKPRPRVEKPARRDNKKHTLEEILSGIESASKSTPGELLCPLGCGETLRDPSKVPRHLSSLHRVNFIGVEPSICKVAGCGMILKPDSMHGSQVQRHYQEQHILEYRCPVCPRTLARRERIMKHIKDDHDVDIPMDMWKLPTYTPPVRFM